MAAHFHDRRWLESADWHLLVLAGDIDVAIVSDLARVLSGTRCGREGDQPLVIDVSGVTFLDCAGIGVLVGARRILGNRMWVADVPTPVARLLALTGLSEAFPALSTLPVATRLCRACRADTTIVTSLPSAPDVGIPTNVGIPRTSRAPRVTEDAQGRQSHE